MTGLIVFVIALPMAVYVLAGFFLLIDLTDRFQALQKLTIRLLLLTLLIVITPAESRAWIGAAFATVIALHVVAQTLLRYAIASGRWPTQRIE